MGLRSGWMAGLLVLVVTGTPHAEERSSGAADVQVQMVSGETGGTTTVREFPGCAPGTAARLNFLETRLDAGARYATWWWRGFLGGYALGTVVSAVDAATENDKGDRANAIVSSVKSAIGTTRLAIWRPTARLGTKPLADFPTGSEAQCATRLARAEELMTKSAEEAESARYSWIRHAGIVGLNVAGALIVAEGFDERKDAWIYAGVGIAVGELMTWTHPWRAIADRAEYEREFATGVPSAAPVSWSIEPGLAGARLAVRF